MSKKIAIIGSDISGLSCAYLLCEKGYDITVIAKAFSPNITSNRAAAFWFPYHIRNDKRGVSWAQKSYSFYEQLSADASTGISMKQLIKVLRENTEEEEPIWVDFIPKGALKKVPEKDLAADVAIAYDVTVPLIETQIFLPYLKSYVSAKNVKFVEREINSFDEVKNDFDFVINCSALGSQKLCNDKSIIPVRGQVALIETRTDFPIYLDNEKPLYLVPRKDAMIIGGTYEENLYEEKTESSTIEKILNTAYEVFPELKQQKVIGSWAGLRPYRPTVRVEKENNIIHDYGHGGSGFTIAFGCADEVMKLVES
jgi:D-amino-acid oxidase